MFRPFLNRYWLIASALTLLLVLAAAEPVSGQWLRFDRSAIDSGQWWRLLSAHWVHLSAIHALGNSLGLLLCGYIGGEVFNRTATLIYLLFAMLFTGCGLWLIAPDLHYYVGLSGCLHGLLVVALMRSRHYSVPVKCLMFIVIAGKVLWEQTRWYDDQALSSLIGGRVETRAHLLGFSSALLWLLITRSGQFLRDKNGRRT